MIAAARKGLGDKFHQYAPAHPIAGGEMPGVDYASADLFDEKVVISTPDEGMDPKVVTFIEEAWRKAGARVQAMSPLQHDLTFASVSHLPHVLAYALVDMINREALSHELKRYRASLDTLQKYIDESDGKALESVFENAVRNRRGLVFPGK